MEHMSSSIPLLLLHIFLHQTIESNHHNSQYICVHCQPVYTVLPIHKPNALYTLSLYIPPELQSNPQEEHSVLYKVCILKHISMCHWPQFPNIYYNILPHHHIFSSSMQVQPGDTKSSYQLKYVYMPTGESSYYLHTLHLFHKFLPPYKEFLHFSLFSIQSNQLTPGHLHTPVPQSIY